VKPIRELLKEIAHSSDPDRAVTEHAYRGFSEREKKQFEAKNLQVYAGKVRELIRTEQELYIYHTDRLSAFDRFVGMVPYKGSLLAEISQFWLEAVADIVPTHYLDRPHERVLRCVACTPYKVEVVVRGYMAGSMMRAYQKGIREFCGVKLPEGLEAYRPLPQAMITPTTKAAAFEHDEDATPEELVAQGVCTKQEWQQISGMALNLFRFGQEKYAEKGWILVDTKYEFGRDASGVIRVIDEIHTPDSSRLWMKSNYQSNLARGDAPEMLDKENVRRYLLEQGFSGQGTVPTVPVTRLISLAETYLKVAETLTGHTLASQGPLSVSPQFP
jgi:phosphoribosylaminoimidazole-succinocarboxamide synthase